MTSLTVILLLLRVTGIIDWSWLIVFLPMIVDITVSVDEELRKAKGHADEAS